MIIFILPHMAEKICRMKVELSCQLLSTSFVMSYPTVFNIVHLDVHFFILHMSILPFKNKLIKTIAYIKQNLKQGISMDVKQNEI